MKSTPLPAGQVRRLAPDESFAFHCHPDVPCFTACCHDLELALSPYDVLRLRRRLGISSGEFLARYIIVEEEPGGLPHCFLTMVDDGRASCVFLGTEGCTVYPDRPGACRAYPLGRAAYRRDADSLLVSYHVLLQEKHCQGFSATDAHNAASYTADQHLEPYNQANDLLTVILQHERIRAGMTVFPAQARLYLDTLYDIDAFLQRLAGNEQDSELTRMALQAATAGDDATLLDCAVRWLAPRLFPLAGTGHE